MRACRLRLRGEFPNRTSEHRTQLADLGYFSVSFRKFVDSFFCYIDVAAFDVKPNALDLFPKLVCRKLRRQHFESLVRIGDLGSGFFLSEGL